MSFNWSTPTRYQLGSQQQQQTIPITQTSQQQQEQNQLKASTPFMQLEPRLRSFIENIQYPFFIPLSSKPKLKIHSYYLIY
jgi:hypothetical protein